MSPEDRIIVKTFVAVKTTFEDAEALAWGKFKTWAEGVQDTGTVIKLEETNVRRYRLDQGPDHAMRYMPEIDLEVLCSLHPRTPPTAPKMNPPVKPHFNPKTCRWPKCGKTFTPTGGGQRYCTEVHRHLHYAEIAAEEGK